ncbi:MAG: hypothetical protein D6685_19300 [Bacteroidetes bacterium]|nr:hypothetical protein AWN76_015285 [Rhodothermaceae bacterium RA]RMH49357.1 MAG: hypothetical protein D6685_19300 [Bacteroidota bacterium]
MMRTACLILLLAGPGLATAQEARPIPIESLYVELFGNTRAHSFNVDVVFPSGIGFRIGFISGAEARFSRTFGEYVADQKGFSLLLMLNGLHGSGRHHLETGAGLLVGSWEEPLSAPVSSPALTATLGYRYQPPQRGLVVRAGFTPAWDGSAVRPMVGVSIGYAAGRLFR